MTAESSSHRWSIDGLEEDSARIEEDGGRIITVPRWLLPADAKEGQLLALTRTGSGTSATITIAVDAAATTAALAASADQVARIAAASKSRDKGGDVSL
jgi:hypothetical protein